jgi:hypothetical protein
MTMYSMDNEDNTDETPNKLLSTAVLIGAILLTLLGGLALVVRSLRNVELKLNLELKKDDKAQKKY